MIKATDEPTCNSNKFDFFVISEELEAAEAAVGVVRLTDGGFNPHSPVRLLLRGDGRRKMVRELKRPTKIPGLLPPGPMADTNAWEELAASQDSISDKVAAWYKNARVSLRSLMTGSKNNGIEEAVCCWKPAIGEKARIEPGSSWRSDTWRVMAKRFTEIMHLTHRQADPTKDWAVISSLMKSSEKLIQGSKHPDDGKQLMLAWFHEAKEAADGYDTVMLNRLITVASDFASAAEEESMKKDSEQWRKWAGSEK